MRRASPRPLRYGNGERYRVNDRGRKLERGEGAEPSLTAPRDDAHQRHPWKTDAVQEHAWGGERDEQRDGRYPAQDVQPGRSRWGRRCLGCRRVRALRSC